MAKVLCFFIAGADNVNGDVNDNATGNIIFTIKDAKLHVRNAIN